MDNSFTNHELVLSSTHWMQRFTAQWMGKLLVINDLNLSLLITQTYCITLENLKLNFYNTCYGAFVSFLSLKASDPMHCTCTERSDQHSLQNWAFHLRQKIRRCINDERFCIFVWTIPLNHPTTSSFFFSQNLDFIFGLVCKNRFLCLNV